MQQRFRKLSGFRQVVNSSGNGMKGSMVGRAYCLILRTSRGDHVCLPAGSVFSSVAPAYSGVLKIMNYVWIWNVPRHNSPARVMGILDG